MSSNKYTDIIVEVTGQIGIIKVCLNDAGLYSFGHSDVPGAIV